MRSTLFLSALLLASACQSTGVGEAGAHPFVGCWESESGQSREVWVEDPSGWLFGYAANRNENGDVGFFEHMRVERSESGEVFVAIGGDISTTRFQRQDTSDAAEYRFVNSEHDYPQVIVYRTSPGRLDAEISLLDGSRRVDFKKAACKRN